MFSAKEAVMDRWHKTALGAAVVLSLVAAGGGASAQTFQKGRIYWSPTTYAAAADGDSYAVKGAIGSQYRAL